MLRLQTWVKGVGWNPGSVDVNGARISCTVSILWKHISSPFTISIITVTISIILCTPKASFSWGSWRTLWVSQHSQLDQLYYNYFPNGWNGSKRWSHLSRVISQWWVQGSQDFWFSEPCSNLQIHNCPKALSISKDVMKSQFIAYTIKRLIISEMLFLSKKGHRKDSLCPVVMFYAHVHWPNGAVSHWHEGDLCLIPGLLLSWSHQLRLQHANDAEAGNSAICKEEVGGRSPFHCSTAS